MPLPTVAVLYSRETRRSRNCLTMRNGYYPTPAAMSMHRAIAVVLLTEIKKGDNGVAIAAEYELSAE